MKKLLCLILAICAIPLFASAETDLKSMSYDDLLNLRKAVEAEIMSRPEWKEVTVPSGTWIVGVDIPAGFYSLHPGKGGGYITISRNGSYFVSQGIRSESDAFGKIELIDGDVVQIERGSIVFAPPASLGF